MIKNLLQQPTEKSLPVVKEQLVGIIMEQAVVISELQTTDELRQEIQRLSQ